MTRSHSSGSSSAENSSSTPADGSCTRWFENDLVDQLRLMVYPVILGAGHRLFGDTINKKRIRLLDMRTVGDSLAYLTYELIPDP